MLSARAEDSAGEGRAAREGKIVALGGRIQSHKDFVNRQLVPSGADHSSLTQRQQTHVAQATSVAEAGLAAPLTQRSTRPSRIIDITQVCDQPQNLLTTVARMRPGEAKKMEG